MKVGRIVSVRSAFALLSTMAVGFPHTAMAAGGDNGNQGEKQEGQRGQQGQRDNNNRPTAMTAQALLCYATAPTFTLKPIKGGVRYQGGGEGLMGEVLSTNWTTIQGAGLSAEITHEVTDFLYNGTFQGKVQGTLSLAGPNGMVSGKFEGIVDGLFDPVIAQTNLLGSLESTDVDLAWKVESQGPKKEKAVGVAGGTFSIQPNGYYCAPLTLKGIVS